MRPCSRKTIASPFKVHNHLQPSVWIGPICSRSEIQRVGDNRIIRLASACRKDGNGLQFGVGMMFSILFRTMLIAAQVLTGFWGNSTLCLRGDGTFCCVHDRAHACSCGEHEHEHRGHSNAVCGIARNHEQDERQDAPTSTKSVPAELPLNSSSPCECRHLPLASDSAPASEKISQVTSSERRHDRPSRPVAHYSCATLFSNRPGRGTSLFAPRCRTVGLTTRPSTVIRC